MPVMGLLTKVVASCGAEIKLPIAMAATDWLSSPPAIAMSRQSARKRFKEEQRIDRFYHRRPLDPTHSRADVANCRA